MTCDELRPDYLLYAMGTMDAEQSSQLRAHLERGCPVCTEGMRQAQALAYSMGAVLAGPEAPRGLRGRVLGIATQEERPALMRPTVYWRGWAVAAAAAVLLGLIPGLLWHHELAESRAKEAATATLLAEERRSSVAARDASHGTVPIFALELERGGGAGETLKQLALPRGIDSVVLALPADLVRHASAAALRDATGRTIWTASSLSAGSADSAGLTIDSRLLSPGRYEVVLQSGERTLARLPFAVTAP